MYGPGILSFSNEHENQKKFCDWLKLRLYCFWFPMIGPYCRLRSFSTKWAWAQIFLDNVIFFFYSSNCSYIKWEWIKRMKESVWLSIDCIIVIGIHMSNLDVHGRCRYFSLLILFPSFSVVMATLGTSIVCPSVCLFVC